MLDKKTLKNRQNFFNKKYSLMVIFIFITNGLFACELNRTNSVQAKVLSRPGSLQQLQEKLTQQSVKEYSNGQAHNNGSVVDFSVQSGQGILFLKNRARRNRKRFFNFSSLHIKISQADDSDAWEKEKAGYGIS